MAYAVAITRLDLSASQLRAVAAKEKDATATRRILALALVLEGADRTTAARSCSMDRQTLRDWVHRYTMENVWAWLRANKLAVTVFDDYDDIVERSCEAWRFFANDPDRIAQIVERSWATVNLLVRWYD